MTDRLAGKTYMEFMGAYARASEEFMRSFTARHAIPGLDESTWTERQKDAYYTERGAFEALWTEKQTAWAATVASDEE
ncbi:hypothetical protein [Rhodococcus daqingensis]|uniref:TipAS antibiotic-recognition domain-containing protein n=1 Tax=Rhodococcus daqingensis TaxID=2479363 RepID=A0ABW2S555_9NOCA